MTRGSTPAAKDRKASLELVRRAEIVQTTGEDWADVALAVSTVRTARGGSAPELRPLIVRYPGPVSPPVPMGALRMDQSYAPASSPAMKDEVVRASKEARAKLAVEQEAVFDAGGFQVVFRIPGRIAVAAGQGSKSFRIASATIAPELMAHSVPALAETAFLQASFKHAEDAPLLPGRVSIYRDGVFVGRSPMALAAKDDPVRLGFGVDEKVKVARTVVRRIEGTAGLIGSSKTDEREFKTVIRNAHEFAIRVAIEDQLPVSETEDIQVEMLPVSTPPTTRDLRDRRGVMEWAFEAKPGEARDIKLGWRVRWPKEKAVQFTPGTCTGPQGPLVLRRDADRVEPHRRVAGFGRRAVGHRDRPACRRVGKAFLHFDAGVLAADEPGAAGELAPGRCGRRSTGAPRRRRASPSRSRRQIPRSGSPEC